MNREKLEFRRYAGLYGLEAVFARHVRQPVSRHVHSRTCVVFVEQGRRCMHLAGQDHEICSGLGVLVGAQDVHACESSGGEPCSYLMFCLGEDVLHGLACGLGRRLEDLPVLSGPLGSVGFAEAMRLKDCLLENAADMSAQECLLDLGEVLFRDIAGPPDEYEHAKASDAVRLVRGRIETDYAVPIRLDDLAEEAGCTPQALCRAFVRHVGMPPHAYLNQVRVNAARIVLAEGGSLVQAAYDAGFADQSHFCKVFRKLMGMTPGVYIKGLLGGKPT
ncbi:MAG: AraC family transcriptional regulator [Desulfovibrio sp.]|uniref:helix-turn-helix transcriptional regulator n=1 Tax=Desulfovibrio sp. 7SRBS1 TaxID=3378064 RepID=UPI003B411C0B